MADLSHNQIQELIDLYALGALEPDEIELVEDYLAQSSDARAALEQSRQVVAALAWTPEQHDPPAGSYERFMQRMGVADAPVPVAVPRPVQSIATPVPTFGARLRAMFAPRNRWATSFAAMMLLVALGFGGWSLSMQRQVATLNADVAHYRTITTLLSDPGTRLVALKSESGPAQTARTQLLVNTERDQGYLVASGLSALPTNQTYQLWMIADGKPISMGVFGTDAQGKAEVLMQDLPPAGAQNVFGITIEPSGGSQQPTSTPILVGG